MEFPWRNHQKRMVSASWGEQSVTGEFPSQKAIIAGLFYCISLDKRLTNGRIASDLRRYDARCDVTVMCCQNRRQKCIFCSKVTTNPCDITLISTLGTLLGAIESVIVVLAFQYFFSKTRELYLNNYITMCVNAKLYHYHMTEQWKSNIYPCWEWCVLLIQAILLT